MRAVVQVDKRTREVIRRFSSAAEAERFFGYGRCSVVRACVKRRCGLNDWYFRYEEDFDPIEDIGGKPGCPVVSVDVDANKARWHANKAECAKALYVDRKTISRAVAKGKLIDGRYRVIEAGRGLHELERMRRLQALRNR